MFISESINKDFQPKNKKNYILQDKMRINKNKIEEKYRTACDKIRIRKLEWR